ncbi:hypothetical protein J40TS1_33880 [Paenibacillus montaniterrae]|uniref:Uncharacterized protein n=1 Tax=Paenibacillus montaniterrae TaxID=429341 RepID=A0A919YST0_9BACL|nr:hypothetical protein [Paenibacillus montaniterrae]GIP17746.1 hypothetical protein J40TS1_33880 [Paenibacillus montaniterrae]
MKVYVNGKFEKLEFNFNGVNCAQDVIGNQDGLQFFHYNEEVDAYECDQSTFDYWKKALADHEELEEKKQELITIYGSEIVYAAINEAGDYDFDDQPAVYIAALEELQKEKPHPAE